ncbi:MAG: bifunctional diaminohydroxyphosphoribosylaminopyrimidine deaminase/5-amino-6-(5-phosphoribosylamino)uracil reductase RibD [Crocinitomicaceae bacterium]|nr:bifunctional diaminohydroxyphosphoribosylaminopyrimidine deaminase/5-amino-6-(5-phosphoribosylamino)uracil reductase RibD [Crocinitomicaceae bacterium]
MHNDEFFMKRCIQLAKLGKGRVAPNPLVGAVIVHNDRIIGEGYHEKYGFAHAEVNAVNSVKETSLLKDATIYVSLEPCAHFGKTPPCALLLIEKKFKRVVIGSFDTFSEVNGKGIKMLEEQGIEVKLGILEKECLDLNKHFFCFHEKKRPYITLKWAQSPDGFIDKDNKQHWISGPETQSVVHKIRSETQAILVGRKTAEHDNPSLTVRAVKGANPIRIVIDPELKLSKDKALFNNDSKTIILNTLKTDQKDNKSWIQLNIISPKTICETLFELGINSVLIEGGKATLDSFIEDELWDEAIIITGKEDIKEGTLAPTFNYEHTESKSFFDDTIKTYFKV